MARYTDCRQQERKAIYKREEGLDRYDGVDETGEEFARENGVLFYELGEVVESACWKSRGGGLVLVRLFIWFGLGLGWLGFGGGREGRRE